MRLASRMAPSENEKLMTQFGLPNFPLPSIQKTFAGRTYAYCHDDKDGFYLCDESNDRVRFAPDVSKNLPLLTLQLTKAGRPAKRQTFDKQSQKWWKAQCGYHGEAVSGNTTLLQERLRAQLNKGMSKEMLDFEKKMKEEYLDRNFEEIEKRWADLSEQAKLWPRRFLHDSFIAQSSPFKNETLVVNVHDWGTKIEAAAARLSIPCECRKMDGYATGQRLVVVGRDSAAVKRKFVELERDDQRKRARAKQEKEDETEKKFARAKEVKAPTKGSVNWDVSESWSISCPDMEEEWPHKGNDYELEMKVTEPDPSGQVQLYADFDFGILEGILRFVNPNPQDLEDEESDETSESDEDGGLDIDGFDDVEEDEGTTGATPPQFLFPTNMLPSSKARDFKFRWRGEETGEGEIQLGSDEKLCSITFESPNALTGTFHSNYVDAEFRGVKENSQGGSKAYGSDPGYLWSQKSEAAYERARVGRWH